MAMARREGAGVTTYRRAILWGALCCLLLLPLVAMQFTKEVNWDHTDFIAAGLLLGCLGLTVELAFRVSTPWSRRALIIATTLGAVLLIWANAAVGIF